MRRVAVLLFALLALPVLGGCETPAEIKTLSSQQLQAQTALRSSVDKSFIAMEAVGGSIVAKLKGDAEDIQEKWVHRGVADAKAGKKIDADQFTEDTMGTFRAAQQTVDEAQESLNALIQAHRNVMTSFDTMLEAQQTLDQYLHTQNTDELIVNRLLTAVGVARGDIEKWTDAGTTAFQAIAGAAATSAGSGT